MPNRPRILSIANQKGGVGKTTTAINLAAALAAKGKEVLILDLDPQGNASTGLGIEPQDRQATTYDLLIEDASLADVTVKTHIPRVSIAPATPDLSSTDIELVASEKRSHQLHDAIEAAIRAGIDLDFILIDCPPSLSLLTVNAFVASNAVLVPLQAEFFALEGLSQLIMTIREVRQTANPDLAIEGVVLTMYDTRNNLARQVEADARDNLGDLVYQTCIPRAVRISEAPSHAMSVLDYDPASKGAIAYRSLATELLARQSRQMKEGQNG